MNTGDRRRGPTDSLFMDDEEIESEMFGPTHAGNARIARAREQKPPGTYKTTSLNSHLPTYARPSPEHFREPIPHELEPHQPLPPHHNRPRYRPQDEHVREHPSPRRHNFQDQRVHDNPPPGHHHVQDEHVKERQLRHLHDEHMQDNGPSHYQSRTEGYSDYRHTNFPMQYNEATEDELPSTWCSRLIHPQDQCGALAPKEYAIKIFKDAFHTRDEKSASCPVFTESVFCRTFMEQDEAQDTMDKVVDQVQRLKMRKVFIFPPLLLRSSEDKIYQLDVDFVVVCCRNGAVIPVVVQDSLEFYRKLICNMYTTPPYSNLSGYNFLNMVRAQISASEK